MNSLSNLAFASLLAVTAIAVADPVSAPEASAKAPAATASAMPSNLKKPIKTTKITCQDFLEMDDVSRPQLVLWTDGLSRKGQPDDAVFDIERTNTLVPILVEDCTKEPKTSYWSKFKAEVKKLL